MAVPKTEKNRHGWKVFARKNQHHRVWYCPAGCAMRLLRPAWPGTLKKEFVAATEHL